jgi:hypothetical protein
MGTRLLSGIHVSTIMLFMQKAPNHSILEDSTTK